ncbi:hypothetical protein [Streptomyces ossamyceticus]|uniref:hypothetical protein n=1 Tax=Streptomyces ossamyceticus TaxID=249581 RepID=UPI000AF9E75E|nr:hypothetical protein [Streptomyces ossamyceticus]
MEKDKVGSGASGRNGGMCAQGVTISPAEAREALRAAAGPGERYDAFRTAVDGVEELTAKERIDRNVQRVGRLGVAFKPRRSGLQGQGATALTIGASSEGAGGGVCHRPLRRRCSRRRRVSRALKEPAGDITAGKGSRAGRAKSTLDR